MTGARVRRRGKRSATGARRAGLGTLAVASVLLVAANLRTGIASVPPILDDLGLSSAARSLLVTIPVLCFCVGALAGPALRGRLGEERALAWVLAVMLAGFVVRAAWPDAGLFPGTVVAGLGIALMNVLLPSLIRRRFHDHAGLMTAAYTTTMGVAAALAAGVAVPVLEATDSRGAALAIAVPPVALALLLWWPQVRAGGRRAAGGPMLSATSVWRQSLAWKITLFFGLQSVTYYGPLSWLPTIYRDHGIDAASAGAYLMVMQLLSIAGSAVAPVFATRTRDQRPGVVVAVAVLGTGALGLLLAPLAAPLLWAVMLGSGQGAAFSLALLFLVLRSRDGETAANLSSMAQCGGYAIAAIGPLAMGLLHAATGSWTAPLLLLIGAIAVELAAGLASGRERVVRA